MGLEVLQNELWGDGWDKLSPERVQDVLKAWAEGWVSFWTDGKYVMGYPPFETGLEAERWPVPEYHTKQESKTA